MLLLPPITLTLNSKLKHFYELNVKDWNYLEIDCNKKTDCSLYVDILNLTLSEALIWCDGKVVKFDLGWKIF